MAPDALGTCCFHALGEAHPERPFSGGFHFCTVNARAAALTASTGDKARRKFVIATTRIDDDNGRAANQVEAALWSSCTQSPDINSTFPSEDILKAGRPAVCDSSRPSWQCVHNSLAESLRHPGCHGLTLRAHSLTKADAATFRAKAADPWLHLAGPPEGRRLYNPCAFLRSWVATLLM